MSFFGGKCHFSEKFWNSVSTVFMMAPIHALCSNFTEIVPGKCVVSVPKKPAKCVFLRRHLAPVWCIWNRILFEGIIRGKVISYDHNICLWHIIMADKTNLTCQNTMSKVRVRLYVWCSYVLSINRHHCFSFAFADNDFRNDKWRLRL